MQKDIVLLLAGFVVGAMNAIAGGGMLIGFPALLLLGVPAITANAVGNVVTFPGQLASAIGYHNYLRKVPRAYIWLLIPVVFGAILGALTLRFTSPRDFAQMVPLLVLFGVGLFAFQPLLHFHLQRHLRGRAKTQLPLVLLSIALVPLSFYGGYFGAGYGLILLGFLGFTNLRDTHMMNAMKNVTAVFVSGTTIVCLYGAHLIDWHTGLIMAAGSTVGGYIGSRSAQKVSSHWLRLLIICIGLSAVIYLGLHEY